MSSSWMIYGANGYTGDLVARLAAARGQRPVLAGRNEAAIRTLADELALPYAIVDLRDPTALRAALAGMDLVAHCAGPFTRTSGPMVTACLDTGTHYLDVTGELPVFSAVLARDPDARAAGVTLLTGGGFDVVPTDCLAGLLAEALPDATTLEIAFRAPGGMSRGTATTGVASSAGGGLRRVDGRLVPTPFGLPSRLVPFPSGERRAGALPWGDVVTAYHSTGIRTITTYTTMIRRGPMSLLGQHFLRYGVARSLAERAIRRRPPGPSAATRAATGVEIWAEVRNEAGESRTGTVTGPNAYDLTADAVVRAAARLLDGTSAAGRVPAGAHTPATALGPAFLRELDGVTVRLL